MWEWRIHLKQISMSFIPSRKVKYAILRGVHYTNSREAASLLIFQYICLAGILYFNANVQKSVQLCMGTMQALEQISVSCIPSRKVKYTILRSVHHTNSRAATSPLAFQCICLAGIYNANMQKSAQVCVGTTHRLGTSFCELHSTKRYNAWRCLTYELPGSSFPIGIPVYLAS